MVGRGIGRFRLLTLREILSGPGRSAAAVLVIAVSAALLVAVIATYGSITKSVHQLTSSIAGDAEIAVTGYTDTGFDARLAGRIAEVPGVRVAAPIVQQQRVIAGESVVVIGVDLNILGLGSDLGELAEIGLGPDSPLLRVSNGVVAGSALGVEQGAELRIGANTVTVAVAAEDAVSTRLNGGKFIAAPMALAQKLADHRGRIDMVVVAVRPEADPAAVRAEIVRAVDNRAVVSGTDLRTTQAESAVAVSRDSTLLVAAISLVVAGFLIFNSMSMVVMQRRTKIATLRAMGATRRSVVTDLLIEAVVTGCVAAAIGIPLGWLLSRWAVQQVPAFLVQNVSAGLTYSIPPWTYPVVILSCVFASLSATIGAARQVYRIAPLDALRTADLADTEILRTRWTILAGTAGILLMAIAFGMAVLIPGPLAFLSAAVYSIGGILLGIAGMARTAKWASAVAGRLGAAGRLAAAAIDRTPRRSWATAVTAGIAVAIGIGVHGSLADVIEAGSSGYAGLRNIDVIVSSAPPEAVATGAVLPSGLVDRVRSVPGVQSVGLGQWAYVTVGEERVAVEGIGENNSGTTGVLLDTAAQRRVLDGTGIAVSRQIAERQDWQVGSQIPLGTPSGPRTVEIVGLMDVVSFDAGMIAMSRTDLQHWFDRPGATYLAVDLTAAADRATVVRALDEIASDSVYVYSGAQAYEAATHNIRQAGVLAAGLQWTVALVAAVALINTFMLSVLQRKREIGVLRAMGASRRLISRFVLAEAFAVGLVGAALGLVLGVMVHYLATVISAGTLGIAVEFDPAPVILGFAAIGVLICLAGAAIPALQAARMNIVTAIWSE